MHVLARSHPRTTNALDHLRTQRSVAHPRTHFQTVCQEQEPNFRQIEPYPVPTPTDPPHPKATVCFSRSNPHQRGRERWHLDQTRLNFRPAPFHANLQRCRAPQDHNPPKPLHSSYYRAIGTHPNTLRSLRHLH